MTSMTIVQHGRRKVIARTQTGRGWETIAHWAAEYHVSPFAILGGVFAGSCSCAHQTRDKTQNLYDGIILLLTPESFSVFVSYLDLSIPARFK